RPPLQLSRNGSEVQARIECEPSVCNSIISLVASGGIGRCEFPKVYVVDVRSSGHETPAGMVHDVDCIDAEFKFLPFADSDALHEVHIEVCMGRSSDSLTLERADGSRGA